MPRHLDLAVKTGSDVPEAELHRAIKQVCLALEGWSQGLPEHAIEVTQIAGGISNALLKVDPSGAAASLPPVAVRLYGANTEQFIDRAKELAIMEMAARQGFGPRVLATFDNGRVDPARLVAVCALAGWIVQRLPLGLERHVVFCRAPRWPRQSLPPLWPPCSGASMPSQHRCAGVGLLCVWGARCLETASAQSCRGSGCRARRLRGPLNGSTLPSGLRLTTSRLVNMF